MLGFLAHKLFLLLHVHHIFGIRIALARRLLVFAVPAFRAQQHLAPFLLAFVRAEPRNVLARSTLAGELEQPRARRLLLGVDCC